MQHHRGQVIGLMVEAMRDHGAPMTEFEIRQALGGGIASLNYHLRRHPDLFEKAGWRNGRNRASLWRLVPKDGVRPANIEVDEAVNMLRNMADHDLETVAYMLASYDAPLVDRFINMLVDSIGGRE